MSEERKDPEDRLTPDLPPPVDAPDPWDEHGERPEQEKKESPPDPEHGPGDDTATGEPPD